jgi:amino acid adenylation domain-containing protein
MAIPLVSCQKWLQVGTVTELRVTRTNFSAILPGRRDSPVPLSYGQRGLWFVDALNPRTPIGNVPLAVWLTGHLDVGALESALIRLVARHEVLRTSFPASNGEPCQCISMGAYVPITVTDVTGTSECSREARALEIVAELAGEPFDLAAGPLIRAHVVRVGPERHLFGLFLHHIICDGHSLRLVFDELARLYAAPEDPPSLSVQYADFASWQHRQGVTADDIAWWQRYLRGAPSLLSLPADRPHPAVRSAAGSTITFSIPARVSHDVDALARRRRATPFIVQFSAFACLVGRLTGAADILIGVPVSDRPMPELEPLIGYFVNTLPVRVDLSGHPSFADVVDRVRSSMLLAMSRQRVPFDSLVAAAGAARSPSHTPLVQTTFSEEPGPLAAPSFADLDATLVSMPAAAAKFDLSLTIQGGPNASEYAGSANFCTDLFDEATVRLLCDRYLRLLAAGASSPSIQLRGLPVLSEVERASVTSGWSHGGAARAATPFVHDLFAKKAAAAPDVPAVSAHGLQTSYAVVDARSSRLARHLQVMGAGPDDLIGLLLERDTDMITALLGILKAGAAYLPLNPTHPREYVRGVLASVGARLIVTISELRHRVDGADFVIITMEELGLDAGPADYDRPALHPDNLAYAIFTSGSTGDPKPVGVSHRALGNHARYIQDRFGLGHADRALQFFNIAFDAAAQEIYPTLLGGGCVVMCPEPVPPPEELSALLRAEQVTVATLPPSYWGRWVAGLENRGPDTPALRLVVVGGENLDPGAVARWHRGTQVPPLVNDYGLTEATITSATHDVIAGTDIRLAVQIGTPIDGAQAYILDEEFEPVAVGCLGELFLGGVGLARGYLGRPGPTAERFVPSPFGEPGSRLLRTGDRARWHHDGTIEVLGRLDRQLKVGGYRLEPGQIEAALTAHPDIAQATVVGDRSDGGEPRLIGYVVPGSGSDLPVGLRDYLAKRLPAYMVPGVLIPLAALPLTVNGKVDRSALPAPAQAVRSASQPPRTETERWLADVWRQSLAIETVGVSDNFFDLGGTSFTLAAVHARITEHLGCRLPIVTLYEHPTVASLAEYLSAGAAEAADGAAADPADDSQPDGGRAGKRLQGRARQARRRMALRPADKN